MGVKLAALYLLPYVVIGAHEVAATVNVALSDRSAKSAIISEQTGYGYEDQSAWKARVMSNWQDALSSVR